MSTVKFHRDKIIIIGCLLLAMAFTGCAATGEVKGGGTIIGNPNIPTFPTVPKEQYEDPLEQDCSEFVAEAELRRFLWARFLPATLPLSIDPFAPIMTQIGIVRRNLNDVYDLYIQSYIWENLLAEL